MISKKKHIVSLKVGDKIMLRSKHNTDIMFSPDFIGIVAKIMVGNDSVQLLEFTIHEGKWKTAKGKYWSVIRNKNSWYMPAAWFEPYRFKTTKKRNLTF
jgi:hypothetical protein